MFCFVGKMEGVLKGCVKFLNFLFLTKYWRVGVVSRKKIKKIVFIAQPFSIKTIYLKKPDKENFVGPIKL